MTIETTAGTRTGPSEGAGLHCRQISDEDREGVVSLLAEGFARSQSFWEEALSRLSAHDGPKNLPRYGYVLDFGGTLVGILLLIFTRVDGARAGAVRCNVACWYVKPDYRAYAPMLVSRALRHPQVTYVNLTPAPHTVPALTAQGYAELSTGKFYSFPIFQKPMPGARVHVAHRGSIPNLHVSRFDQEVLESHAEFGCMSLVCRTNEGDIPFVFARRRIGLSHHRFAPYLTGALLIYSRNTQDFAICAGTLGRFLTTSGIVSVIVHANGPIPGLVGKFVESSPTYFRGAQPPPLCDLSFSECAMFGV